MIRKNPENHLTLFWSNSNRKTRREWRNVKIRGCVGQRCNGRLPSALCHEKVFHSFD